MIWASILLLSLRLCTRTFDSAKEREREREKERERERSFPREQATRRFPGSGVSGVSSRKRFNRTSCHRRRLRERWGAELAEKERLALKAFAERETCVRNGPRPRSRRARRIVEERSAAFFRTIDARQNFLSLSLSLSLYVSIASNLPLSRAAILRQQRQRAAYVTLHLHNAAANCQCSLRFENKICAAVPRRNGRVYEHTPASDRGSKCLRGARGEGRTKRGGVRRDSGASTWKPAGSVGGNRRCREGA